MNRGRPTFAYTGRLTDLTHEDGTTTFADYDWLYDPTGRVTAMEIDLDDNGVPDNTSTYGVSVRRESIPHD